MDTIAAIAIAILAVIGAWWQGQRSARKDTERRIKDELDANTARSMARGTEAVRDGRDSGLSNDDRVRRAVEYFEK